MASEAPVAIPCVDWNTISEEILCPLCDYNLRGLIEPRCPECGSRYEWDDLVDPKRRKHPYLFEHHPEMNWTSFWRTVRGGLRPIKFWRSLHPVQPSNRRRLVAYALIVGIGFYVLLTIAGFAFSMRGNYQQNMYMFQFSTGDVSKLSILDMSLQRTLSMYPEILTGPHRLTTCSIIGWPILTLVTLMIFGESMRRAKVKTIHVARSVVYSADVLLWLGLVMAALRPNQLLLAVSPLSFYVAAVAFAVLRVFSFTLPRNMRRGRLLSPILLAVDLILLTAIVANGLSLFESWLNPGESFVFYLYEDVSAPFAVACFLLGIVKLIAAYKIYLQFDHPIATVLASQAIVALVTLNVGLYATLY